MLGCKNQLPFNMLSYGSCLHHLQKFSLLKELDLGCPCTGAACCEEKAESSPFLPPSHTGVYSSYRQAIEVSHPFCNSMTVNFIPGHYPSWCQRIKLYLHHEEAQHNRSRSVERKSWCQEGSEHDVCTLGEKRQEKELRGTSLTSPEHQGAPGAGYRHPCTASCFPFNLKKSSSHTPRPPPNEKKISN